MVQIGQEIEMMTEEVGKIVENHLEMEVGDENCGFYGAWFQSKNFSPDQK